MKIRLFETDQSKNETLAKKEVAKTTIKYSYKIPNELKALLTGLMTLYFAPEKVIADRFSNGTIYFQNREHNSTYQLKYFKSTHEKNYTDIIPRLISDCGAELITYTNDTSFDLIKVISEQIRAWKETIGYEFYRLANDTLLREFETCIQDELYDETTNPGAKKIVIGLVIFLLALCAGIGIYGLFNNPNSGLDHNNASVSERTRLTTGTDDENKNYRSTSLANRGNP